METTATDMLVNELTQGQWLTRELESQLNSASIELCKSLAQEILTSFEKAITTAKSYASCPNSGGAAGGTDSPRSLISGSPHSEISELPFKAERKKRKTQPKWTTQVKLGSGPEAEGPLDDGYSWRKYGQKEILGAKHPRGYYRCTHRNTKGCPAMKQVQRSDGNPAIFEVTYRGTHTCSRKSPSPPATAELSSCPNLDQQYHHQNQLLLSFQTNLKVETEHPSSSSFSFPSTPIDEPGSYTFSPASSTLDSCFKRSFTDAFVSSATSDSDFADIISGVTLSSEYPCMADMDFLLQSSELDADFPFFDATSYFY